MELDIDGREITLANSDGFPFSVILLSTDADERTITDDTSATLSVYVGVTGQITDGHTIQTQVEIRYSEGEEGGELLIKDSFAEVLSSAESISAQPASGIEAGVLNPGDVLPTMQLSLSDSPDSNFWGLNVAKVKVTGPSQVQWVFGTDTQKYTVGAGQWVTLEDPVLAALDEGKGAVTLWASVPVDLPMFDPIPVKPDLDIVVTEGQVERQFSFSDDAEDIVIYGGFENMLAKVDQGGRVLESPQTHLPYSAVSLSDQDRNSSYLRVTGIRLSCLGTICNELSNIEIEDGQKNLIGYAQTVGSLDLTSAAGEPLRLTDNGTMDLLIYFDVTSPTPIGGSLLLEHAIEVQEIEVLREKINFDGEQRVVPQQAIFFGKPTIGLSADGNCVSIGTDGQTIKTLVLSLSYGPEPMLCTPEVLSGPNMQLTSNEIDPEQGIINLTFQASRPSAGEVGTVCFKLDETVANEVSLQVGLDVGKVVDTAQIELPYTVNPSSIQLSLMPPVEKVPAISQEKPAVEAQETQAPAKPAFVGLSIAPSYRKGDVIELSFAITDEKGLELSGALVSVSIVRMEEGKSEVVYVDMIPYNQSTGRYELDYDTSELESGTYQLYISSSRIQGDFSLEVRP